MLLARLFVRPIRRLEAGAQQISAGDYGVDDPGRSHATNSAISQWLSTT